jgi:hypothetical protein
MAIRLVMTCHAEGWREYGRQMAATFAQYWPVDVELQVYAEGFVMDVEAPNVTGWALPDWHEAWKLRHDGNPDAHGRDKKRFGPHARRKAGGYDYRRDCVRFSHKVAALTDSVERHHGDDLVIMVDADVVTHAPVTHDWLRSLVTHPDFYVAWLDRVRWYPECGFVIFNERWPGHRAFMNGFREIYETDRIFALNETHDSFVLQHLVKKAVLYDCMPLPFGLSGRQGKTSSHPFVYSRLAECLDHAKGKFKHAGRTPRGYVQRNEDHWR